MFFLLALKFENTILPFSYELYRFAKKYKEFSNRNRWSGIKFYLENGKKNESECESDENGDVTGHCRVPVEIRARLSKFNDQFGNYR